MNIRITDFSNPFSFFCKLADDSKDGIICENNNVAKNTYKHEMSDLSHGQYVAVLWNNKWTRGVVTMESQFLIWLIDHGFYLRPNEKTVYIDLPAEYRKYPTKIFEASIHGVVPVDKALTDDCKISDIVTNSWNKGVAEKTISLISKASKIYFVPVALLSTKYNDVVLGDLYIKTSDAGIVNIVNELEMWPVFLKQDKKIYIDNLSLHYSNRRKHRACSLKPDFYDFPDLPVMSLQTTLKEYNTICENTPRFAPDTEYSSDGSTVVTKVRRKTDKSAYKLTPSEVEHYSCRYVTVCGREYNVLNVLLNKIRDLTICERYKDHDRKSIGRANYHSRISEY